MLAPEQSAEKWLFSAGGGRPTALTPLGFRPATLYFSPQTYNASTWLKTKDRKKRQRRRTRRVSESDTDVEVSAGVESCQYSSRLTLARTISVHFQAASATRPTNHHAVSTLPQQLKHRLWLPLSREKKFPDFSLIFETNEVEQMYKFVNTDSKCIFWLHSIKLVLVVESTHCSWAKWSPSDMQQTFISKLNLCYDTKVRFYYRHIIKVVLHKFSLTTCT